MYLEKAEESYKQLQEVILSGVGEGKKRCENIYTTVEGNLKSGFTNGDLHVTLVRYSGLQMSGDCVAFLHFSFMAGNSRALSYRQSSLKPIKSEPSPKTADKIIEPTLKIPSLHYSDCETRGTLSLKFKRKHFSFWQDQFYLMCRGARPSLQLRRAPFNMCEYSVTCRHVFYRAPVPKLALGLKP